MNFKKNLIFLSALALCGSAAFSGFGNGFFNISSSVSVSADENDVSLLTAFQNKLIRETGYADLNDIADLTNLDIGVNYENNYKILRTEIKNINGTDYLLVYRLDKVNAKNSAYVCIDLYKQENSEVVLKDTYTEGADNDNGYYNLLGIHINWCDDFLCLFRYLDMTYGSSTFAGIESIIKIENDKFHAYMTLGDSHHVGGIVSFRDMLNDKTYIETDSTGYVSQENIDNGLAEFKSDMNNIGFTKYTANDDIVGNGGVYNIVNYTDNVVEFSLGTQYKVPEMPSEPETPTETAAWKDAYKEILKSCDVANAAYGLYDLDNDGIPELFVPEGGIHYSGCNIYSYADGEVVSLGKNGIYGWIRILTDTGDIIYGNMQQGGSVAYSLRKSGNKIDTLVSYIDDYFSVTDNPTFTVNDKEVSAKEYVDSYNSNFKGREELTLGMACNCPSVSDYSLIDNYTNNKDSLSMQGKLSINEGLSYEEYGIKEEPEKTQKSWQKAYADFISGKDGKFSLVYIDNDDIPELIYATSDGGSGISIYKYSDGEVKSIDNCGFADNSTNKSVAYLEKQNLICVTDARTNGKYYYLYTIENDELKENGNISFGYLNKDFSIDGNPATEDECNAKADEYKIPDMTAIDRDAMYDINEENVIKYLSVENDTQETEKPQNNNTNNNNNNTKNNTANNGGKSATADKTGVSPDTGDKGTGIALCVAASAVMAAWITRKKD